MRLVVLLAVLCAGCGTISEMKGIYAETQRTADVLEKELGTRPEIGFNVMNGNLANLNVIIDSSKVQQLHVSELEIRVHKAIAVTMKEKPGQILVSLRASALNVGQSVANRRAD